MLAFQERNGYTRIINARNVPHATKPRTLIVTDDEGKVAGAKQGLSETNSRFA